MADPRPIRPIKPPREATGPGDTPRPPKPNKYLKNKVKDTYDDDEWGDIFIHLKPLKVNDPPYSLDDYQKAIDTAGYSDYELSFLYMTLQMRDEREPHDEPRAIYPIV